MLYCSVCPCDLCLSVCLSVSAQAFHGALESFVTWLRSTERKIQRDDPLKLEEEDLRTGLKQLKETAADIDVHRDMYEAMCSKCEELIARGAQDSDDLRQKLDNVQQRWNAIQVMGEVDTCGGR